MPSAVTGESARSSNATQPLTWKSGPASGRLSRLLDLLSEAPEPADLLRSLIHTKIFAPGAKAGACGMINQEAELVEVASYGLTQPHGFVERQNVWQKIPPFVDFAREIPIRRSVTEMRAALNTGGIQMTPEPWAESVLIQPIHGLRGAPLGAFIFIFDVDTTTPINPLIAPHDLHSALVLAMRSEPFQRTLQEQSAANQLDLLLTDRELSCLKLAARGHTNKDIAKRLKLSHSTVKLSFSRIYDKLGVNKRREAIDGAKALRLI